MKKVSQPHIYYQSETMWKKVAQKHKKGHKLTRVKPFLWKTIRSIKS